jgi:copper transport protein
MQLPEGEPPRAVSLKFSESVQIPENAIRVIAAGAGAVALGEPEHGTSDSVVSVRLPKLADGTYVVSWRVVSTDAHVISGALSFSVGPAQGSLSAALPSGPGPNRVVGFVFGLTRMLAFFGVLVLIGSVVFVRAMWPKSEHHEGVSRLILVSWIAAFITSIAGIGLQAVAGAGAGLGSVFDTALISDVLATDYGHALVARALLLVAVIFVLWLFARDHMRVGDVAGLVVGAGLVVTFLYAGHAHTGRWVGLALITDALHVSAAAVWLGGLCALAVTLFNAGMVEHARYAVSRFSMVAAPAIALVALSGIVQTFRQVGNVSALFDTNFGRWLLLKVAIVLAILVAANTSRRVAGNRLLAETDAPPANRSARRKARTADRSALSALRKAVSVEVAFAIVVLAVTAVLTNTQPSRDVPSGEAWAGAPFSEVLQARPLALAVSVTPGHTGPNRVTLTPRSGSALARVVDVDGSISQPDAGVAKLSITFARQANGSYTGSIDIPLPGIWQLDLSVLRTQFDESRARADLPIGVADSGAPKPTPTTSGLSPTGVARVVRPFRDKLLAGLARDQRECPSATRRAECRALLDEMDATAVSLSRTLRASSPVFSIESTMYFTVDIADEFAEGISSYRETGCADPQPKVPIATCRQNAHLYRAPASELERNLRGWDQYLGD